MIRPAQAPIQVPTEPPPALEPLDAPFDQYQRYAITTAVARAMGPTPPRVLDVGGHHLDFWARPRRPIAEFLPEAPSITVDLPRSRLPGYSTARGDALPFRAGQFDLVCLFAQRTVLQQAIQQEDIEEARLACIHAQRRKGADIDATHLDVLDAAARQRGQRRFTDARHALGADRTVELILDLQQALTQLLVFTALSAGNIGVRRVRLENRASWPL